MEKIVSYIASIAWLAAAASVGWMAKLLAGPPANSVIDTIALLVALAGAAGCVFMAWKEYKAGRATPLQNTSQKPAPRQISVKRLTEGQITDIHRTLEALSQAGLIDVIPADRDTIVEAIEEEGWGDGALGTYEVLLTMRWLYEKLGMDLPKLVFTCEGTEQYDEDIQSLVKSIVGLMGYNEDQAEIRVHWPDIKQTSGHVDLTLLGETYHLPCEFHAKYTPSGLIEELVKQVPQKAAGTLHWEFLDSAFVFAMMEEAAAKAFNETVLQSGDGFQWRGALPFL